MRTITSVMIDFVAMVEATRAAGTANNYGAATNMLSVALLSNGVDPDETPISAIDEDCIGWLASLLKSHAPKTESVYLTGAAQFFEFVAAERLANVNLPRVRLLIRRRSRRLPTRLPSFPKAKLEQVIEYALTIHQAQTDNERERWRNYRDRALIVTLADTGLRIHEACQLRRGQIDWQSGKAPIIGKGNYEAIVRFSTRSLHAIGDYLSARQALDGQTGRPLGSLPVFARHDRGAGRKVRAITTTTGRNIVNQRVTECLGADAVAEISPHSFRHYFVTRVLQSSKNLKLAQSLARHRNIQITQLYAHLTDGELDAGYKQIFN